MMRTVVFGSVVLAGWLLTGCARIPERDAVHTGPPAELDGWSAAAMSGEVQAWLTSFDDPQLTQLIREALDHNYNLQAAVARVDVARAQVRIVGSDRLPQIGLGATAARSRTNAPLLDKPVAFHANQFETPLFTLSWELDVWGRIRAQQQASAEELAAAQADLAAARLSLAARTAQAYFEMLEATLQVQVVETSVRERQTIVELVQGRYRIGLVQPLDLRFALADVADARRQSAAARNQLQTAMRVLETLLGRYPQATVEAGHDLPALPTILPAGVPAQVLSRRPDLQAAFARLRAEDWRVASAQAAFLPRVTLTGSGGLRSEDLVGFALNPASAVWNIAGGALQPLFTGGRLTGELQQSEARVQDAINLYRDTTLTAFREVEQALAAEEWLREQERQLAAFNEQTVASRRLAVKSYRRGQIGILTLLDSYRSALDSATAHLTARRQLLSNRVNLYLALGGPV